MKRCWRSARDRDIRPRCWRSFCFNVFSVERIRALSRKARTLLDQLGYQNIALHVGDGTIGWSEHAPYDAILVSAGSPATPKPLLEQLGLRGRLVIPVGDEQNAVAGARDPHPIRF